MQNFPGNMNAYIVTIDQTPITYQKDDSKQILIVNQLIYFLFIYK